MPLIGLELQKDLVLVPIRSGIMLAPREAPPHATFMPADHCHMIPDPTLTLTFEAIQVSVHLLVPEVQALSDSRIVALSLEHRQEDQVLWNQHGKARSVPHPLLRLKKPSHYRRRTFRSE